MRLVIVGAGVTPGYFAQANTGAGAHVHTCTPTAIVQGGSSSMKRGREDESSEAVERPAGPLLMESSLAVLACLEEVASMPAVLAQLIMGYRDDRDIYSTGRAFAAKLADGRVVTWGRAGYGGDSSSVQAQLQGVDTIYSTEAAFAAKLADGRVVTWGGAGYGGDSSSVQGAEAASRQTRM